MPKEQKVLFVIVFAAVAALNTPETARLGSIPSILFNALSVAVFVAVGYGITRAADKECGRANFFGLPRSRRLIFVMYGGYLFACTLGVFGGTMSLSGRHSIPFPLRMPDTSLLTLSILTMFLSFLDIRDAQRF